MTTVKSILCLGNNSSDTDSRVQVLALATGAVNHGLIDSANSKPQLPGYYHTTVVDIPWGDLIKLSQHFDHVIMLDQPQSEWSHWKCLQATYKLMTVLEQQGRSTQFRENQNVKRISYWTDLLTNNKSFCMYPWIEMFMRDEKLQLCARSAPIVTTIDQLHDWRTDKNFAVIREKMLAGEMLEEHCATCYNLYERKGIESYRQFESLDWVMQLDIDTVEDLQHIDRPYFYEIHSGNHCNLKCRGCDPSFSRPIGTEMQKFNIEPPRRAPWRINQPNFDHVDIDRLDHRSQVFILGGEPTIMPEVADFLKRCIAKGRTDFNFSICTNAVKISDKFLSLLDQFTRVSITVSLDGYGAVNDYWRSGSQWDRVIENMHLLESHGHKVNVNTVPGIYNVTNLHLLFEFLDKEFPFTTVYLQLNYKDWASAFNHPDWSAVIDSLERCKQTGMYHSNGKSCRSSIDALYDHYVKRPGYNEQNLKQFFDYMDQLDRVRNVRLADHIPELEACRKYAD